MSAGLPHRARRFRAFAGATINGNPSRLFSAATLRAARRMAASTRSKTVVPPWATVSPLREDLLDALIFFRIHEGSISFLPCNHESGGMQTRIVQRGGVGQWKIEPEEVREAGAETALKVRERDVVAASLRVPGRRLQG